MCPRVADEGIEEMEFVSWSRTFGPSAGVIGAFNYSFYAQDDALCGDRAIWTVYGARHHALSPTGQRIRRHD